MAPICPVDPPPLRSITSFHPFSASIEASGVFWQSKTLSKYITVLTCVSLCKALLRWLLGSEGLLAWLAGGLDCVTPQLNLCSLQDELYLVTWSRNSYLCTPSPARSTQLMNVKQAPLGNGVIFPRSWDKNNGHSKVLFLKKKKKESPAPKSNF